MIDHFSLALSHGLMLLAAWRLIHMVGLDREPPAREDDPAEPEPRFHA